MILETVVFAVVAIVLLALLVWLLREPSATKKRGPDARPLSAQSGQVQIEDLFPLHCRYFPQVRRTLAGDDAEFLQKRVTADVLRRWRMERRRVAAQFVAGLQQDFERLSRLARTVAALSPQVSREKEEQLLWLGVRFRVLFLLVRMRLTLGWVPLDGLTGLANLVTGMAERLEAGMAVLEESSLARLRAQQPGFSS